MRTAKIKLGGQERTLCFSVRVLRACVERYGSLSGLYDALSTEEEGKSLDEALWILAAMMAAGKKYAEANGLENPEPMTVDELMDTCDMADFVRLRGAITETLTNGSRPTIEVEPEKNGQATQGT